MKCDISLKVSGLKTEVRLIKKWSERNIIKKSPESAMATFFAMDDFKKEEFAIIFVCSFLKI
jgi:hypothetical protein